MKNFGKNEEVEEGELPDEDPTPSDSINPSKETYSVQKHMKVQNHQDSDESSDEIIFETITQKDYSPQRKKKKIQKPQPKAKPKEKEKTDRSSFDREKLIQKRKSPTPTPNYEDSPQVQRDYHQPPPPSMGQPYFNPYMYMPPAGNMMPPHMYPPQYPPLPYVHPSQFHYPSSMPTIPQKTPIPHPHYGMQPQPMMYPGYQPKPMMAPPSIKQPIPENPKYEPVKHHQMSYPIHPLNHPQPPVLQKYPYPNKIEPPINYGFQEPPNPYLNNQNPISKPVQNQPQAVLPPPSQSFNQSRPQVFEKPKEKEKSSIQIARQKKIDHKNEVKKQVKQALKDLPIEFQEELLEAIRCILKYSHVSRSLFSSEIDIQSNASLNCYQKNLSKIEQILRADSGQANMIQKVLLALQMKQQLCKIKERILYHKLLTEDQRLLALELRAQIQQKGY